MNVIAPADANFHEWSALLDVVCKAFAYMDGIIDPPSSAKDLTVQSLAEKAAKEQLFIARDGATLVGCLYGRLETNGGLYIGKLAVDPDYQGQGIGQGLLAVGEMWACRNGCSHMRLETRIELVGNHRFFERCGFEKTKDGRHPGFDRTTFIEMQKRLVKTEPSTSNVLYQ